MYAKVVFLFVVAFAVFQFLTLETDASVVRREADDPQAPKLEGLEQATKELQDALNDLKSKLDELANDVQNDPLVKNITESIQREFTKLTDTKPAGAQQ